MNATKKALLELKQLANKAADTLYRRIELSVQVLGDMDWIAQVHGGSDLKAQDALQSQFFRDLGGFISLGKLCAMFRHVPKSKWNELRYDVAAVEVVYDDAAMNETTQGERGKRTAWKALAEERAKKIAELEAQIKQLLEANGKLREEATESKARAARLEGRIEEIERRSEQTARR